jgi:hypothetical protein
MIHFLRRSPARSLRVVPVLGAALVVGALGASGAFAQSQPATSTPASTPTESTGNAASGFDLSRHRFLFQTSVFGRHFSPSPDHTNHFRLINLEAQRDDSWLYGFAFFRNSFNQPSQYLYFGKRWNPFASYPQVNVKLTGGILHGYKGEYRDKIPFNGSGIAPALLPSIGWSNRRFASDFILFGTAGLMITAGIYLD